MTFKDKRRNKNENVNNGVLLEKGRIRESEGEKPVGIKFRLQKIPFSEVGFEEQREDAMILPSNLYFLCLEKIPL